MKKVVLVLKRSKDYDYDYVDKLVDGLEQHCSDFELDVIEDPPWPRWWSKMGMFSPDVRGDFLYLDLDTVLVGNIDDLFIGKLTVLTDLNVPGDMASGIMFVPEADREEIWRNWIADPDYHIRQQAGHGDGGFLSQFWKNKAARWQNEFPGRIVSFKNDCKQEAPQGASVICYHGQPRPRDTGWATGDSDKHRSTAPSLKVGKTKR